MKKQKTPYKEIRFSVIRFEEQEILTVSPVTDIIDDSTNFNGTWF